MIDNSTKLDIKPDAPLEGMQCYSQPLLISFSGGRTSAFMARLLMELPKYKNSQKLVVFAK